MLSNIPSHYSDRYINQRYNKALYIVQHLPTSSNVQPTKEQKLELYALYKQVSQGNIDNQRPGIFDVVGRAKWDAWKNVEGMGELDAKHRYVGILLSVATEAYKKPAGRAQAHQIIQSFAIMQPSGDSGDSSSEEEESSGQDDDSTVAEELAYLRQVQKSTPAMSRSTDLQQHRVISQQQQQQQQKMRHWHDRSSSRASSQSGHMSMMTAPSELRRLSQTSQNSISNIRSLSAASGRSTMGLGIGTPISRRNMNRRKELYDDHFDDSVNPWSLHPSTHQYKVDEPPLANRQSSQQDMSALYRSPVSTSSSATATQQYTNEHRLGRADSQTAEQTVLGPATKRALEALQREIEVLNERINELRKELVDRDQSKRIVTVKKAPSATTTAADDEGWKWVFKAAVKHALMNLMTGSVLLLVLYKKENPVAYAILGLIQRFLLKFKVRV